MVEKNNEQAIGCIETSSVVTGIRAADAMLKAARVRLLFSSPVCPGKYLIITAGAVADTQAAVAAGKTEARDSLVDEIVIPNVHPQVLEAFSATTAPDGIAAMGVIETFSLAAAIIAGDQAVKSARVDLLEIRLARALGGKGYVLLTGEVSAVRAAVEAGQRAAREHGLLLATTVIPAPHPDLVAELL